MDNDNDNDNGLIPVVVAVVLVQAGIALLALIEVILVSAFGFGQPGLPLLATLAGAVTMLYLARAVRRRRPRARRLLLAAEVLMITIGVASTGLALLMTGRPIELVPAMTHFVMPVAVIWLLRRPEVRAEFPRRRRGEMPAPLVMEAS